MSSPEDIVENEVSSPGRGITFLGWGAALPDKVVTNADLEARLDTSDEWITERTGIRERRVGGTSGGLAVEAGRAAIAHAGIDPSTIDVVVLATTTPDQLIPATASYVQQQLGLTGGAFDVTAACSGFVYGLVTAAGLGAIGAQRILLIGADVMSSIVDQDDRAIAILFGDGAGAVIIETVPGRGALLGWDLGSDGDARSILYCDHGGVLFQDGREVFRKAVRAVVDSAQRALARAGLTAGDVDLFVPHQANLRIIEAAGSRLGIPLERTAVVLDRYGNTSAASIPLAVVDAIEHGRLSPGDTVLSVGFGAGMAWASAVLEWPGA